VGIGNASARSINPFPHLGGSSSGERGKVRMVQWGKGLHGKSHPSPFSMMRMMINHENLLFIGDNASLGI